MKILLLFIAVITMSFSCENIEFFDAESITEKSVIVASYDQSNPVSPVFVGDWQDSAPVWNISTHPVVYVRLERKDGWIGRRGFRGGRGAAKDAMLGIIYETALARTNNDQTKIIGTMKLTAPVSVGIQVNDTFAVRPWFSNGTSGTATLLTLIPKNTTQDFDVTYTP